MAFCVSCGSEMDDTWMACPKCGTAKGGQTVQYAAPQIIQKPIAYSVQQPKSKGIAFILNFLIPGIGHMYLENTDRGLPVAIISTICALIIIGLPVYLVLWIWMLIDTSNQYDAYLMQHGLVSNQVQPYQ